jgi:hypothetical protein
MATCADILGAHLPEDAGEDSLSFLPSLKGVENSSPIRRTIVHHSGDGIFSIRDGQWKLILGRGSGGFTEPRRIDPGPGEPQGQLYNMQQDFKETQNLWHDRPQIVERLISILNETITTGRSNFQLSA